MHKHSSKLFNCPTITYANIIRRKECISILMNSRGNNQKGYITFFSLSNYYAPFETINNKQTEDIPRSLAVMT